MYVFLFFVLRAPPPATTSQPRKGDVTGCQFGALGACPVVPGGFTHPTGWWGRPNHRQLSREVLGTRDPTTARDIRCLHGAVGLGPGWRRAGLESAQGRKHAANCNGGRGEGCRVSGGPARLRLRMAILEQNALARKSPCETRVVTTAGFKTKPPFLLPQSATANLATVLVGAE
jgi:hypothetical protein